MTEETLFHEALAKPPAGRAAFLEDACAGQPALRAAVEALLAAHDASGSLLDRPPAAAPLVTGEFTPEPDEGPPGANAARLARTADYHPNAEPGAVIAGRYTLQERIGEGGMGEVWVAKQTEPVKRRVALKLIKAGMDTKAVLQRFEAERQALAMMDHPNIAKVLDGGMIPFSIADFRLPIAMQQAVPEPGAIQNRKSQIENVAGRPFFVMELVNGLPLTKFCDEAKLGIRERLELFTAICQAVQHAHQKGIIHRDLKPSNILVTLIDARPVPKVIDFGVAKAIGGKLLDESLSTQFGAVVGTLEYMAPEQAGFSGSDIDTRADIYSLGVILYELLTGLRPIDGKRLKKAALTEMIRIIQEDEPSKPSTRLSTDESLPSLAASRHIEPKKLMALLRGELDWVVMKCLEKQRERRYETANAVARDVQRYLADEAVEARPPSAGYRLSKFLKRNKGPVIAACLVLFALLAGMAGTVWQAIRAETARAAEAERAEGERLAKFDAQEKEQLAVAAKVEAQAKEAEANAVVAFFENQVFAAARPKGQTGGLGKEVSLRDAIVASLPALGQGFAAQPLVEARLRHTLGKTFFYLAEYEQARDQFEQSRALCTRHRGPDHPDTLRSMMGLANSYADLNRPVEALKLHEEVLEIRKRVLPRDHPDTLRSMNNLAISYADLNRPAEALKLREEVLEIQKRVLPKDHPDTLSSMNNLALSYKALNRPAEALKLKEEVLETRKRVLPKDHPDTLSSMNNLANSYAALNRPAEALKLREEALEIRKRVLPKDHPDTLSSMNNLAISYTALNRPAEALKLKEEVLEIRKRVLPKDHPDTLSSMNNLANSYAALNRPAEALNLREEALEIRKRVLPKDDPDTLSSMNNLANSYAALNRHAEALKLREEALAIRKRVLPKDHPNTLSSMWGLAESLIRLDRGAEAIPLIDECVAKAAGQTVDPDMISGVMALRMGHFRKVGDPAGCRATAAMWEKLNRPDVESLYNAACYRAVTAAVQAKTPGADAARLAKEDADRAMQWLHKAVQAGYKNAAHMKKDTDLDPLRGREDFKQLIEELEKKSAAKPEK